MDGERESDLLGGYSDQDVTFFRNVIVQVLLGLSGLFNVVVWLVLILAVSSEREVIILHYNVYLGVDMIGTYWQIFFVPSIGILFLAVNTALGRFLYASQERIAAYMLLLAGLMIEFGILIAAVSIALVNY